MLLERVGSLLSADYVPTVLVFVFVLWACWIYLRSPRNYLPPGPWGIPLIGYLPFVDRHLSRFAWNLSKKYNSDVVSVRFGPDLFVFVNSYSAAKEAFHSDILTERPESIFYIKFFAKGSGLLSSNGPLWKEQRRFSLSVLRDFGMGKMASEQHIINEIQNLSAEFEKRSNTVVNVAPLFTISASNVICITAFGKQYSYDDEKFLYYATLMNDMLRLVGYSSLIVMFPQLRHLPGDVVHFKRVQTILENAFKFIDGHLEEHRAKFDPSNIQDFIDAYLAEQERQEKKGTESSFSDEQLKWTIFELFFAGTDTTSTTLQWAILYMIRYPDVQEKVQAELDEVLGGERTPSVMDRRRLPYTDATLLEVMRLAAVVPVAIPHSNNERDVTFRGYTIPKGAFVHPNLWAVHRDPKVWKNPDEFDPSNFLNERGEAMSRPELMPFSTGRRQCVGESLARMETFLVFASLLQKFKFSVPPGGPEPTLEPIFGLTSCPEFYETLVTKR